MATARYTLDGEPTTLVDFLAANVGELDAEEIQRAVGLAPGESMTFGGGAAATFVLARLADEDGARALTDLEFSLLAQFAQAEAAFCLADTAADSAKGWLNHGTNPDPEPLGRMRAELKRRGVL